MRIAVSADTNQGLESQVAQHFGRCPFFALVEVDDNQIQSVSVIDNPFFAGHEVGQVPNFINEQKADVMLSGGWGEGRSNSSVSLTLSRPLELLAQLSMLLILTSKVKLRERHLALRVKRMATATITTITNNFCA